MVPVLLQASAGGITAGARFAGPEPVPRGAAALRPRHGLRLPLHRCGHAPEDRRLVAAGVSRAVLSGAHAGGWATRGGGGRVRAPTRSIGSWAALSPAPSTRWRVTSQRFLTYGDAEVRLARPLLWWLRADRRRLPIDAKDRVRGPVHRPEVAT